MPWNDTDVGAPECETSAAVDATAANIAIALALQQGSLAVNSVLSSLYPVFTALAAIIILHERPSRVQTVGVGFAVGAIVALAF